MGHSRWKDADYASYSSNVAEKPRNELFHRSSRDSEVRSGQKVNIEEIEFRESRDSEANPCSTPIIVGLDVTGSMGMIPEKLTKGGLGTFVEQTLERKPITDPHFLFLGIGDAIVGDQAPLQATQFEADNTICDQLTDIWLEGGGGGNQFESYDLAWAFAIGKCRTDAWDKRQEKGFLFTVGDEEFPESSNTDYIAKRVFGQAGDDTTPSSLLESASERWNIFHVIIAEGSYADARLTDVEKSWQQRLGKRAMTLGNYHMLPQLMVAAMAVESGTLSFGATAGQAKRNFEVLGWAANGVIVSQDAKPPKKKRSFEKPRRMISLEEG